MESYLFARLAALNNPHFDFSACNFSEKNMQTKDKNGESKVRMGVSLRAVLSYDARATMRGVTVCAHITHTPSNPWHQVSNVESWMRH